MIRDVNSGRPTGEKLVGAIVRQCIKPELLQALCILKEMTGASSAEEAIDESVDDWFAAQLAAEPKDISERIKSAIDSVRFEHCRADPSGAIISYEIGIVRARDENNASDTVHDSEKCKSLLKKLIQRLEPEELRVRVSDQRTYWSGSEKCDLQFIMKRVCALAVEVHNGEIARAKIRKRSGAPSSVAKPSKGKRTGDESSRDTPNQTSKHAGKEPNKS